MLDKQMKMLFGEYAGAGKYAAMGLLGIVLLAWTFSINTSGYRTVVQYPWGTTVVKFKPGIYFSGFGNEWVYKDAISYAFYDPKKVKQEPVASIKGNPIPVRYQDGGTGSVVGNVRVTLPSDEPNMLDLHREFRSNESVANNLIKTTVEQAMNLTAGLMSSEESYAEKREIFGSLAEEQARNGTFQTELVEKRSVAEGDEEKIEYIPIIKKHRKSGVTLHNESPFKRFGISVSQYQVTDWDYEAKTLKQVDDKRQATMGIITAKANAERAKWEKEEITAEGEKEVERVRLEKEKEKIESVVDAERAEEVAIINARQEVKVNEQNKLAAEEDVKAAKLQAIATETRSVANADAKKREMLADGALEKKLATYEKVSEMYATAMSQQKWVPDISMGGTGGSANNAQVMIETLTAKALKDLSLDMNVK